MAATPTSASALASACAAVAAAPPASAAVGAAVAPAAAAGAAAPAATVAAKAQPKPSASAGGMAQLSALPPHLKLQILSILKANPLEPAGADAKSNAAEAAAAAAATTTAADGNAAGASGADDEPEPGPIPVLYDVSGIKESECKRLSAAQLRALQSDGYVVVDGLLGADACAALHAALNDSAVRSGLQLKAAGMRAGWKQSDTRGDSICWLHSDDSTLPQALRSAMVALDALRVELNRSVDLKCASTHTQLALYDGGGARYVRHCDTFEGGPKRRITLLYYINPHWQPSHGGCLRVFLPHKRTRDIEPKADRVVLFLSQWLEHEVLPAHAPRLALTTWLA